MTDTTFSVFLEGARRVGHALCMPQIVLDELSNKYREELSGKIRKVNSLDKDISRLAKTKLRKELEESGVADLAATYAQALRRIVKSGGGELIPYPDVAHKEMAQRAMRRIRPFEENDKGYRDTLVWLSVLDLARARGPVQFISKDRVFCDGDALHPDLRSELTNLGLPQDTVTLHRSLASFVDRQIKPVLEKLDSVADELRSGLFGDLDLKEDLAVAIEAIALGLDLEDFLPEGIQDGQILAVPSVLAVQIDDVRRLPSNDIFVEAKLDATLAIDYRILLNAMSIVPTDYVAGVYREPVNRYFAAGTIDKLAELPTQLVIDPTLKTIKSVSVLSVNRPDKAL